MKNSIKRIFSMLLALTMVFSMSMPAFAADAVCSCDAAEGGEHSAQCAITLASQQGEESKPHEHSYTSAVTTPASCFVPGLMTYTCAKEGCDKPTYTEEIAATGEHNFVDGECSNDGCSAIAPCDKSAQCAAAEHDADCLKLCDQLESCPAAVHQEGCLKAAADKAEADKAEAKKQADIAAVQTLIDALPDVPVGYLPENVPADIAAKLQAITDAIKALPQDVQDTPDNFLNMARYYAFYSPGPAAVAKIGNTSYDSLNKAVDEAKSDDTIVLTGEITITNTSVVIPEGKTLTLDLNGYTISAALDSKPAIRVLGNLTVEATNGGGIDTSAGADGNCYCFIVGNDTTSGTLTINGGTFKGGTSAVSVTKGELKITGGSFESTEYNGDYRFQLNCIDENFSGGSAKIEVTGGTFKNFDPSNNKAESGTGGTNFVAEGCGAAYDANTGSFEIVDGVVSDSNGDKYPSLQAAFNDAPDGSTLSLLGNVMLYEPAILEGSKKVTLDLAGLAITCADGVYPAIRIQGGSELTVTGNGSITNAKDYVFVLGSSDKKSAGTLNIENGSFTGETTVVSVTKGTATIEGGHFVLTNDDKTFLLNCIDESYKTGDARVIVTGGTFDGFDPNNNEAEPGDNTNYVSKGYGSVKDADGNYVITDKVVAQVGDNTYATLENAIAAAKTGGTVKLLDNVTLAETLFISGKSITLDMNQKKIDVAQPANPDDSLPCAIRITNGGALTVTGNGIMDTVAGDTYCFTVGGPTAADESQSGSLTIVNGLFKGSTTVVNVVRGSADIEDGGFESSAWEGDCRFQLNCYDANRAVCSITVKGGSFKNFNPYDNLAENPKMNFVVSGKCAGDPDGDGTYNIYTHDPDAQHNNLQHWCSSCMIKEDHQYSGNICGTCGYDKSAPVAAAYASDGKLINEYSSLQDAINADGAAKVKLIENIAVTGDSIRIPEGKTLSLDLNGKTISANLNSLPAIRVLGTLTVEATNGGSIDSSAGESGNSYCLTVGQGGTSGSLTVKGGSFKGGTSAISVTRGQLEVKGGSFESTLYNNAYEFQLNIYDANRDACSISVSGGEFKGFDPGSNAAEGQNTNFLADGFCSNDSNSDDWYEVHAHSFSEYNDSGHWCANCQSEADAANQPHSGGSASCTTQAVCTACSQPYGPAAGHALSYALASGKTNVIVETCTVTDCKHYATATLSTDKASYTYTGKEIKPVQIAYSVANNNDIFSWAGHRYTVNDIVYTGNVNPGTATASLTVSKNDAPLSRAASATASLSFEIDPETVNSWEHSDYYRDSGKSLSFTIELDGSRYVKRILLPMEIRSGSRTVLNINSYNDFTYSVKDGDLVITLNSSVMAKLGTGRYTLHVNMSADDSNLVHYTTSEEFRVRYPRIIPSTGDPANFLLWGGMLLAATAALGGTVIVLKKNKKQK